MVSLFRALAFALVLSPFVLGACAQAARQGSSPRIFNVEVSTRDVHAGQTVLGHVTTSYDVASVEARVVGFSALLDKRGAGDFSLNYTLPSMIPSFLHGRYVVNVIARTTEGVATTRELPVTLH
jgi:hypothetical protein